MKILKIIIAVFLIALVAATLSGCVCPGPTPSPTPTPVPEDADNYPALHNSTTTYPNMASYRLAMSHQKIMEKKDV